MKTPYSKNGLLLAGIAAMLVVALVFAAIKNSLVVTIDPAHAPRVVVTQNNSTDWRTIPFVNVRTKQNMTFADFAGKMVVVETVSIWCGNCVAQQKESAKALTKLGDAAPVYISLDLDIAHPNDDADSVANHPDYKQFPWIFAITNKTLTRALINQFGYNVLNPPITPIFVIYPNGTASELYTDNRSADDMLTLMQAGLRS